MPPGPAPGVQRGAARNQGKGAASVQLHQFEIVGDLRRLTEHDGSGTVLLGAELHRPFHRLFREPFSTHPEMDMDAGKHLGLAVGAFRFQLHLAEAHVLAALLQDVDHVELGTATHAQQQHLHGTYAEVAAAVFLGTVHDTHVSASRFTQHQCAFHPFHSSFHLQVPQKIAKIGCRALPHSVQMRIYSDGSNDIWITKELLTDEHRKPASTPSRLARPLPLPLPHSQVSRPQGTDEAR